MPFDPIKLATPATQSSVADVAIDTTVALHSIMQALEKLADRANVDISDLLEEIKDMADSLNTRFDTLTGYVPDEEDGG